MGIASTEPLVAARPRVAPRPFWVSRLLAPTLCDLFFFMVVWLLFLSSGTGWSRLLWDGDTGLHIAIGNFILDHHSVPTTDPFSFTQPNGPWLAVEWGTGALFAVLNGAWGLKGVVFLCGMLIAALITVLLRSALSNRSDTFLAIILVLFANNALALHYHARPHLFTLLFIALSAWIINRDRVERTRWIWFLPVLTVLWANLHPGFVILFAYLALVIAGCGLELFLGEDDPARSRSSALRYTRWAAICAAASLLNPFGYHLHLQISPSFDASGLTHLIPA